MEAQAKYIRKIGALFTMAQQNEYQKYAGEARWEKDEEVRMIFEKATTLTCKEKNKIKAEAYRAAAEEVDILQWQQLKNHRLKKTALKLLHPYFKEAGGAG